MTRRRLIFGSGVSLIDEKNRVTLPADIRKAIIANNGKDDDGEGSDHQFVLGKHPQGDALIGFDTDYMAEFNERIRAAEASQPVESGMGLMFGARRSAFPRTEPVPFDKAGRFTLSAALIRRGHLVKHVFFYGIGDYLELWNPHLLISLPDIDAEMKEEARECLAERGWLQ